MRNVKLKKVAKVVALVGLGVVANAAMAQTSGGFGAMTADAVGLINGDIKTGVMAVGGAVIGLAAVAMGIRWVKATFF
ncbi:major capsid protein [Ralstonia mannitolilytica]|uniref:major capsid protein n=1 Tax=Ralstonia mannitolilytica TaxID=105219 RepID=UPI000CEE37C8|nr:major capsid protein [Ralstonia mannitolilytica]